MNPILQKILTLACIGLITIGIALAFLDLAIWLNTWWSYPLGLGFSILAVLGAFEIVERSKNG